MFKNINSNFSSTYPHIYKFSDVLKSMQLGKVILNKSSKMETKIIKTATTNKTNSIYNLIEKLNTKIRKLANKFKSRRLRYDNTIQQLKFLFLSFILS